MTTRRAGRCLLLLALPLPSGTTQAGDVEVAPFFGLQYGSGVWQGDLTGALTWKF